MKSTAIWISCRASVSFMPLKSLSLSPCALVSMYAGVEKKSSNSSMSVFLSVVTPRTSMYVPLALQYA